MGLSQGDRALRRVTAWGLIWALAFLIPYGVLTETVFPPLLLIPQGLSFFCALYHLSNKATCRQLNVAIDTGIAGFMLVMMIIANVEIRRNYNWRGQDLMMLGAYGTVPAMINVFVQPRLFKTLQMDLIIN